MPISLPSMITLLVCDISRCRSSKNALTSGIADTAEAIMDISGVLISPLTSSPSSSTICSDLSLNASSTLISLSIAIISEVLSDVNARREAAKPMALYNAPVSTYIKPSSLAASRAMVDFPAPAGPSIAIAIDILSISLVDQFIDSE